MKPNSIWRWLSVIVMLAASVYFIDYSYEHIGDLKNLEWGMGEWFLMAASLLIWVVVIGIGGTIWRILLFDLGHSLSWRLSQTIFALSQFGKYLPGNVAHHVGRVIMASNAGIPSAVTLQTLLIELVWAVGVAAGVALLGLLFFFETSFYEKDIGMSGIVLAGLFFGALLLPAALVRVINALMPKQAARLSGGTRLRLPSLSTMTKTSFLFLLNFLSIGFLLDLQARYLFDYSHSQMMLLTTIYAWAWIAGYLTPGAPAGLGVREAVLVSTLSAIYGPAIAVGLSLTLRVSTTFGDGLAFVIGLIARRMWHEDDLIS